MLSFILSPDIFTKHTMLHGYFARRQLNTPSAWSSVCALCTVSLLDYLLFIFPFSEELRPSAHLSPSVQITEDCHVPSYSLIQCS